jgi:hypothetical protein
MPKYPVDFAGPSHFGGKDQQVLCVGKGSLTDAVFFRLLFPQTEITYSHMGPRIRGVTASPRCTISRRRRPHQCRLEPNPAADPFMFATGSYDGAVRICTAQPTPHFHVRRISGSVTSLSDTSSQLQLDPEPRAESSTGQQRLETDLSRVETLAESSEGPAGQSSEHTIVFSTPRAGGTYPTHL